MSQLSGLLGYYRPWSVTAREHPNLVRTALSDVAVNISFVLSRLAVPIAAAAAHQQSIAGGITATQIGVGIAAVSAIASAASAHSSARGVALSHRPFFVVGAEHRDWTAILHDQGVAVVGVRLS